MSSIFKVHFRNHCGSYGINDEEKKENDHLSVTTTHIISYHLLNPLAIVWTKPESLLFLYCMDKTKASKRVQE